MVGADGSVLIKVGADTAKAEQQIAKLKDNIYKMEKELKESTNEKTGLEEQFFNIIKSARIARTELKKLLAERDRLQGIVDASYSGTADSSSAAAAMEASSRLEALNKEIAAQEKVVAATAKQEASAEKIAQKIDKITSRIDETTAKIDEAKKEAGELQQQIDYASSAAGKLEAGAIGAGAQMAKFEKRIAGLAKRVFIFTVFTAGLRMMRNWLSDVIKQNDEASASIANLKASLIQMATPLLNVVIPAFIFFTNVLAGVVQILGTFFSLLFGAGDSATALNEQADAIDSVGGAAKKASRQLAGFDTINKLSAPSGGGGGGGAAATDLSATTALEDKFKKIAVLVLAIGAAIAGWNIAGKLQLGTVKAIGLSAALAGLATFIIGVSDAWKNGLGTSNFLTILAGAALLVGGLTISFGVLGAKVGLLTAGIGMLVIGLKDYLTKGKLTDENLGMIALGILAVGAAVSLMTTSIVPAIIAGILAVSVILANALGEGEALIDGFVQILKGFVDFIKGAFTGDWEMAWEGLKNIAKGVVNAVIALLNSLINGFNKLGKFKTSGVTILGKEVIPAFEKQLWKIPNIPYLAQGAVIPPNQQFLAVLGDQKSGTNIEAPLSTIKQAVLEAMAQNGGGNKTVVLQVDGREFASIVFDMFNMESQRLGVKAE